MMRPAGDWRGRRLGDCEGVGGGGWGLSEESWRLQLMTPSALLLSTQDSALRTIPTQPGTFTLSQTNFYNGHTMPDLITTSRAMQNPTLASVGATNPGYLASLISAASDSV